MTRTTRWTAAFLLALWAFPVPARAYVPEETPRRRTRAALERTAETPAARPATASLAVMRGGRLVAGIAPDRPMIPASLMKLATTTAVMVHLGPAHRFATRVLTDAPGPTPGTLYLVGGGDPTFATRAYRRIRYEPKATDRIKRPAFVDASPTVEDLAARVAAAGVREVTGDLVADDSLFDAIRTQRGWLDRYLRDDPDTGLLDALTINEGIADLERTRIVQDPAIAAARALETALAAHGIRVRGSIVRGIAPSSAVERARVASPPVAQIIDFVNRYSINFPAEMMLKGLGAAVGGEGSTAAGVEVVRRTLRDLGVPLEGFRMTDGSGLSVLDRMSARTLGSLLTVIQRRRGDGWGALRASIPVAGRPGTLLTRMTGPPTGGNLRGKTGFLRGVRAMAGWVRAGDGIPVVYVALFNDAPSAIALTGTLDFLGRLVAAFPRP